MFKQSILNKVLGVTIAVAVIGLGGLIYMVILNEQKSLLEERKNSSRLMASFVLMSIYEDMMDERADMVRHLMEDIKKIKGTERVQIIRNNSAEEAFQDFKTLRAVEKEYGELKREWVADHPNKENNIAAGIGEPKFREALKLFNEGKKDGVSYIEESEGKRLFTYLMPIEARPRCYACHTTAEEARGVLMISTSLEDMYAAIASSTAKWLIYGFFIILGISILLVFLVRNLIRPLHMMVSSAKNIASGNFSVSIPVYTKDEIGVLSESFNDMATQLRGHIDELGEKIILIDEQKQKYENLVNNLNVGIYRCMTDGRLVEVNDAAVIMLEADSKENLLRHKVMDFHQDKNRGQEIIYKITKDGFLKNEEMEVLTVKGHKLWCSLSAVAKKDIGGSFYIDGIVEDITERKKLEEQLRQSQKMEAVGELAGGIAHDFSNMLTAIIGYGTLLMRKKGKDRFVKEYVEEIIDAAQNASNLTRDILAFSRKHTINPKPADLNGLVKKVEKILTRIIGEHIEIKTNVTDKPLIVKMETQQVEQVLLNLATNARDAMPRGGKITISAEHTKIDDSFLHAHGYGNPGSYALIAFADTGSGIPRDIQSRIFEPFFTTKEVGKGTGLGLSMAYGIIKQHNGYIHVYSEPGIGTVFKIYLPLTEETLAENEEAIGAAQTKENMETILIAEDMADVRKITRIILEEAGYKVIEAVDGEDAVNKFIEHSSQIKLLILDMMMPKMSGKDAYKKIRKIKPDIKAIFISGYTADMIKTTDLKRQGFTMLAKPIMPDKLLATVNNTINK